MCYETTSRFEIDAGNMQIQSGGKERKGSSAKRDFQTIKWQLCPFIYTYFSVF